MVTDLHQRSVLAKSTKEYYGLIDDDSQVDHQIAFHQEWREMKKMLISYKHNLRDSMSFSRPILMIWCLWQQALWTKHKCNLHWRCVKFLKMKANIDNLPPIRDAVVHHIQPAHYQSSFDTLWLKGRGNPMQHKKVHLQKKNCIALEHVVVPRHGGAWTHLIRD